MCKRADDDSLWESMKHVGSFDCSQAHTWGNYGIMDMAKILQFYNKDSPECTNFSNVTTGQSSSFKEDRLTEKRLPSIQLFLDGRHLHRLAARKGYFDKFY